MSAGSGGASGGERTPAFLPASASLCSHRCRCMSSWGAPVSVPLSDTACTLPTRLCLSFQMLAVPAVLCVCAAAWCSQALAAAAAVAAAGGRSDGGNFLDDKQWLTTISQYDKEVGQWNKFRDVSAAHSHPQTRARSALWRGLAGAGRGGSGVCFPRKGFGGSELRTAANLAALLPSSWLGQGTTCFGDVQELGSIGFPLNPLPLSLCPPGPLPPNPKDLQSAGSTFSTFEWCFWR